MIVAGSASPLLLASAAGGYNLTRSLRFRSSAEGYLSRTPSNTATSGTTWTVSFWVKPNIGSSASRRCGFSAGNADATGGSIQFLVTWQGYSQDYKMCLVTGQGATSITTSAVFRDPSAWYHVVVACDTTQATASNRWKIYVNGVQQTIGGDAFGGSANYPTQNTTFRWNASGQANFIGASDETGTKVSFMDGYMTEFYSIDGQALTPSSFGENNEDTGVWQPIRYAGTYGTNGFYLPFTNNSTTTTLGNDFSGNGNNWTTNNISLTAGATYDSMTDVPTLTSATAANFAVLNPLYNYPAPRLSNANLTTSNNGTAVTGALSTIGVTSGKWYFEATNTTTVNASTSIGIVDSTFNFDAGAAYIITGSTYRITGNPTFASYTNGDTIGVAFDADASTISFYKNGTLQGTGNYGYLTNGTPVFPYVYIRDDATGAWNANFGQRPFAYTPPTGFVRLNTFNLPTPTIGATATTQANKYFDATTYTGNGTGQSITNSGSMSPDLVWVKIRSGAGDHYLADTNRGVSTALYSNNTDAERTESSRGITAFNSNGFTLGLDPLLRGSTNLNGATYVGWQWRGSDSTAVTNTAGSITSTVSANPSAGFSVVTYTGTGANATVGHGLGVAPSMFIVKSRGNTRGWQTYHVNVGNNRRLLLNTIDAQTGTSAIYWNNTTPTSTVFSLGTDGNGNASGENFVAYCFAEIAGYSKMGTYTGTSTDDGTFTYTGFKPAYIIRKRIDSTSDWWVVDDARSPNNEVTLRLYPNVSDSEGGDAIDFLSNGFKQRANGAANTSGATYIYMAFAETPLKYTNAR
jgi:hypothetical protein